jgi:hypothetical protein
MTYDALDGALAFARADCRCVLHAKAVVPLRGKSSLLRITQTGFKAAYPDFVVAVGENAASESAHVGLCADCGYMQRITSDRGSTFYLCGRSAHDPSFPKYPRLPVIRCPAYDPKVFRIHKTG